MIESEIKSAWKCGFVAALEAFTGLKDEFGEDFLWKIAEAEWQDVKES